MAGNKKKVNPRSGRFAYEKLDRIMHEKARLGILTSLATRPDGLRFGELKELCALTDGNLSPHLQILEEAGLVDVWKGYSKRRPQTLVQISPHGRERFIVYLEELERVVQDADAARRKVLLEENRGKKGDLPDGWAPA